MKSKKESVMQFTIIQVRPIHNLTRLRHCCTYHADCQDCIYKNSNT